MKKTNFETYLEDQLKDPVVRESFEDGLRELRLGIKFAKFRKAKKLSQAELAHRSGTSQSIISRIECGIPVSLITIYKVAKAMGATLRVDIIDITNGDLPMSA